MKSSFIGTEKELDLIIKEFLPKFVYDNNYIKKYAENHSQQDTDNIKEALVECIERKYITEIDYNRKRGLEFYIHLPGPTITKLGEKFLELEF